MADGLQRLRYTATTLSPLHIGGAAGKLLPIEYAQVGGKVYVPDEGRLSELLADHDLLDDFLGHVRSARREASLTSFLKKHNLLDGATLEHVSRYSVLCDRPVSGEIHAFIRDVHGHAYVPGSSVKGAIRVAIMYRIMKRYESLHRCQPVKEFVREVLGFYSNEGGSTRRYRENFGKGLRAVRSREQARRAPYQGPEEYRVGLDEWLLQMFNLPGGRRGPHTDILRVLRVVDSDPFPQDALRVEEVVSWDLWPGKKGGPKASHAMWLEVLPPQASFVLEITLDQSLLREFAKAAGGSKYSLPTEDVVAIVGNPIDAAREMARDLLEVERRFLEASLSASALRLDGEPDLRVGWGGGLMGMTLFLLLDEGERRAIRDTLLVSNPGPFAGAPAPLSRRLTADHMTLGWLKLEPAGD